MEDRRDPRRDVPETSQRCDVRRGRCRHRGAHPRRPWHVSRACLESPAAKPLRRAATLPGENRLREVPVWRAEASPRLLRAERPLPPRMDYRPPAPMATRRARISVGVRVAYGGVAALAFWLLHLALAPALVCTTAQAANQVIGSLVLLLLALTAGFGLCRVPVVRYACALMGVWLMLSPLLLPGPYSGAAIFGGLAAFGAAGWAADAVALRP